MASRACVGPSIIADVRFADRAVKAASRAQRGRSEAERLDGADANRKMDRDGPLAALTPSPGHTTRNHCQRGVSDHGRGRG
jgi:hypothetical protein